ncbi:hypothetical protein Gogos_000113 [Gossypium gossypioides]|nr:hypothetical protein [Gossypium gossypioides]
MLHTLCKPFLAILNSFLMSVLRTPNPHLPLWPEVPMFWIMILLILVFINSMLIGLIWEQIMMRVMIINNI